MSKSKQKYYAVRIGKVKGIYFSWEDCKAMTTGVKNASFKSFDDICEALSFIEGKESSVGSTNKIEKNDDIYNGELKSETLKDKQKDFLVAYVDGSYNSSTKKYSSGGIILLRDKEIHRFSFEGRDSEAATMRNVAGEIEASVYVMNFCKENGYSGVNIHYDYNGIEKWCSGEWKAKKTKTKEYKSYYDGIKNDIIIEFTKVEAHSGDMYNDIADGLAKDAIFN